MYFCSIIFARSVTPIVRHANSVGSCKTSLYRCAEDANAVTVYIKMFASKTLKEWKLEHIIT